MAAKPSRTPERRRVTAGITRDGRKASATTEDYATRVTCCSCGKTRTRQVVGVREHTRSEVKLPCPNCRGDTRHTQTLK